MKISEEASLSKTNQDYDKPYASSSGTRNQSQPPPR